MHKKLLDAYRDSDYVVFGDPALVLRIGEPSPRLDRILEVHGAPCAAFLTAANPGSEPRGAAQNLEAMAALDGMLAAAGYPRYPGEGRAADGSWREPSVLAVGIYRENAEALGKLFGQNAVVFIEKGRPAELLPL